jgi:hypothetical protein
VNLNRRRLNVKGIQINGLGREAKLRLVT